MRVAALYDIHGNLPALEAVLEDIRKADVDQIVVGGDVVPGPMPSETLECLLDLDTPTHFIEGNGETEVLAQLAGIETGNVPESVREAVQWVGEQISPEQQRQMGEWPAAVTLNVKGIGDVLFCHATPRNNVEIFTHQTSAERVLQAFGGVSVPLVVCGHTHLQFDRLVGDLRIANAGSVGMPFSAPGAYWLLLGPNVTRRVTVYDFERAARRVRATDYPQAEDFAGRNILRPPTEEQMLAIYANAELR
jgi:predicted phosphodiesterase